MDNLMEKLILVTGAAGFIGSNLINRLNQIGYEKIIAVDNLKNGKKIYNLNDLKILDFIDKDNLSSELNSLNDKIETIFHLGACSDTTEWDGEYLMRNNYDFSKSLLSYCSDNRIKFLYASSASVYGLGLKGFKEQISCENPLNAYAYSKFQFDQFVRASFHKINCPTYGFRYFNVYGPREGQKGKMASPAHKFFMQARENSQIEIFNDEEFDKKFSRDFVYVDDCVDINIWFHRNNPPSGLYNVGSGKAGTFFRIAQIIQKWFFEKKSQNVEIKYIDFPDHLIGAYQAFTCAELFSLRNVGYSKKFISIEDGVNSTADFIDKSISS